MAQSRIGEALRRPSTRLAGVVGLLMILLVVLLAYELGVEYEDRLSAAQMDLSRQSRVLAEHTSRTIEAADLALIGASETFNKMAPDSRGDRNVVGDMLKSRLGGAPQIRTLVILDRAGRGVGNSVGMPAQQQSFAGSEFFAALRDDPGIDVHVGRPERSVVTGRWVVAISRKLRAPDGAFDGVAVAFVEPSYFGDFYKAVVADSGNSIALATDEGYLVARAPEIESLMGLHMPDPYFGRENLAREPTGFYRATTGAGGGDRIVSFRKVAGWPLVIIAGADIREVLAKWYEDAVESVFLIVAVLLAVGLLAVILLRQIRRVELSEAAARLSEQFLREALDAVPTGISIRDASSRHILINRALRERFGLGDRPVLGLTVADVFSPENAAQAIEEDRAVLTSGTTEPLKERTSVESDGVRRTMLRGRSPVFAGPDPRQATHVVTVSVDITERKALEEQLAQAKRAAELANRSKSEFLANMSHELRTPLNAVIGFSEIINRRLFGPIESPRYVEYMHDIHNGAQHLLGIINDVLDMSRIEAGQVELAETQMDIADLVGSSLRFVTERAGKAGVKVSSDVAPGLPALRGDQRKMKQVLINLLTNAIKFTAQGGKVVVSASLRGDGRLVLAVADTGIGIAESDMEKIFQPFHQVSDGLSRSHDGTGLGLPIAKSLVELHGGELSIESEVGKGTTVTITLPATRSVKVSAAAAAI